MPPDRANPQTWLFWDISKCEKTGGSFQHPPKALASALALPPRPPGRIPTTTGLLHLGVSKAEHPLRADFASWQLWSNWVFAPMLLGLAWSCSGRDVRLGFTRGRRNFRLETSGKVGCLFLLFNQLERCRVELEVTGRGSRLVSGWGRIC